MKRVRLGSSAIASVRYEEKERTLDIEFREGETYQNFPVPEFVYRELMKAESAGAFWNQVKDKYDFARLEREESKR